MNTWRDEILAASDIAQDADLSVPDEERERRFNRFVEMVDGVKGDEDDAVFLTLLDTLTDQRERVTAFITAEERDDGWLDHDCKRGKLRFG